ncbi:hypothetical protein ATANTOWER_012715 [Ataeniobius toweri]|uniref:Uncharacterized protein n=1 Tax=Ataeniobius toweri TaxID=208326 RepID=A0ABU7C9G6_9TELE|nr:hypothetical protein [Ataeniobius toweri]
MSEPQQEKRKSTPKRIFLNRVDSYSSRNIAKFLSKSKAGVVADDDEEEEEQKEEEVSQCSQAFQVVGTVCDPSNEPRPYVLEEYCHLDRENLLSKLMECHVVIYNISQDAEQVEEATWAVKDPTYSTQSSLL